jgi:CRISPR-associated protein Csd1
LHEPKIKGVNGSQGAGALLVSFNASAYESYDKNQSYNAPVSSDAAFKYTNALNYLLRQNERRILLGDATIVFWAEQPTELEKFISDLFGNTPRESEKQSAVEDRERVRQARQFLTQLRDGTETTEAIAKDNKTSFFILGLSPNNARLSVRLWVDTNVGELKQRLGQHLRDLALEDGREGTLPPSLRQIVAATGRAELQQGRFKGFDTKHVSPLLAASLARAVLTGGAYPQSLLTSLIRRIHADGVINTHRCAAIKACLVRGWRLQGFQKEVGVALDRNLADPAYNVGRLFALLEKIQTDSVDGELNATIKDRYFSSASSTPAVVFPRLLRLNQHHLAKLATGSRIYYDKLLGEVMSKLSSFPRHLPLEDQGQFAIGYFHQRQDLFKSKKSESQGDQQ